MKAIMISIQPQVVRKILKGKQTIIIRKTMPKCELPVKVYIYCTKEKTRISIPVYSGYAGSYEAGGCCYYERDRISRQVLIRSRYGIHFAPRPLGDNILLNGKVVAEFTLNEVEELTQDYSEWLPKQIYDVSEKQLKDMCLTQNELWNYGKGKPLFAWHIDDLKIYDTPRELREFKTSNPCIHAQNIEFVKNAFGESCPQYYKNQFCRDCKYYDYEWEDCNKGFKKLKEPPSSWCYCAELEKTNVQN